jgi:putative FmdB family regulatory protein
MPTYEYACKDCGEHLEVVQSFKDDALTECPNCSGNLRKVFSAAGIIFKGSGWHVKDYASSSNRSGARDGDGADAKDGGGSKDGADTKDTASTETGSSSKSTVGSGKDGAGKSSEASGSGTKASGGEKDRSSSSGGSAEKKSA